MIDTYTLELSSPITEEQWDMMTDVDFDRTEHISFYTKHGKEVHFYKNAIPIQFLKDWSEQNEYDETIPRTIPLVLSDWEDWREENDKD